MRLYDHIADVVFTHAGGHDLKRAQKATPSFKAKHLTLKVERRKDSNAAIFLTHTSRQLHRKALWQLRKWWLPFGATHRAKNC